MFVSKSSAHLGIPSTNKPLVLQQIKIIETDQVLAKDVVQADAQDQLADATRRNEETARFSAIVHSIGLTIRTKWFWYSILSSLCWTAWAFTAKLGSREIPPTTMEFISAFGFLSVTIGVVTIRKVQKESNLSGRCYALVSGLLLALGGLSLYGAYRTGHNTSIVTAITSLYPVITFLVAVVFLRERLNRVQLLGFCFAAAAIFILSLKG
jgi:bacterial/archaeal transporter family protein